MGKENNLINKFFYINSYKDIFINYILLLLNIYIIYKNNLLKRNMYLILIVIMIQLLILCIPGVYGISLIWCGFLGLLLNKIWTKRYYFIFFVNCLALVYYFFTYTLETTIAHLLAVFVAYLMYLYNEISLKK